MKLSLGFSPCPNDTFIFDALVNNKIYTEGVEFDPVLEDVETLNLWAMQGKLSITKLSFPAFFKSIDRYLLLDSGSALGRGVGPLLISGRPNVTTEIERATIVLPGANTTAHLLFSFAFPGASKKRFTVFSDIEAEVLSGKADLGVIIHENRFTYHERGLHKVMDLGEYWEDKMKVPVPLGGIAILRSLGTVAAEKISALIKRSIQYAFDKYPVVSDYVKRHSQEMSEDVMRKHIDLYVNNYSLDLGADGKKAIETLHEVFSKTHNAPKLATLSPFVAE